MSATVPVLPGSGGVYSTVQQWVIDLDDEHEPTYDDLGKLARLQDDLDADRHFLEIVEKAVADVRDGWLNKLRASEPGGAS